MRDAVARRARRPARWAGTTAYNRGQVLYRLAEMMEARAARARGASAPAATEVERAIDRIVWYAGWADKLAQVLGSSNPVAGPYFNFSVPEPTGVVGVLAPEEPAAARPRLPLAPAIVGGNAVVVVASETHPLAAIELAEALATSDLPGGVVNLLTGRRGAGAEARRAHGRQCDRRHRRRRPRRRARAGWRRTTSSESSTEPPDEQSPWTIASFLELKTVWHPIGQ